MNYVHSVNKQEFELIMDHIGIKKDRNLLNRLFWLFDLNADEEIDNKEIIYSINLFKEGNLEENLETFFELCDDDENGCISIEELRRFFIRNLHTDEEIKMVKLLIKDFFKDLNTKNEKYITKEELY